MLLLVCNMTSPFDRVNMLKDSARQIRQGCWHVITDWAQSLYSGG